MPMSRVPPGNRQEGPKDTRASSSHRLTPRNLAKYHYETGRDARTDSAGRPRPSQGGKENAYCRFSTDDFYAYKAQDRYHLHVAGKRVVWNPPKSPYTPDALNLEPGTSTTRSPRNTERLWRRRTRNPQRSPTQGKATPSATRSSSETKWLSTQTGASWHRTGSSRRWKRK